MTEFTPVEAIIGGGLIGIASVLLMGLHGRIAGMTGILAGILPPFSADKGWRIAFLLGAITGPLAIFLITGAPVDFVNPVPLWAMVLGGVIVGIGVNYGSGCTSGHGVCGMARFSVRSIAATATFMLSTFITVYVVRHILGIF
ncbi:YeeE/YedE family protein [Maritalea sp. S77]|uniref:YeeE/YedE family protein n=1 Tax=Maritalea sp. S77 TaxID=3415125 RepID=UPI003C7A915B